MNVLVAVASRHGSTLELGQFIADTLEQEGLEADLQSVEAVTSLDGYDAVVLGSAIYAGHWLRSARDFAAEHETDLRGRPLWLFSSGPIGDPPKPSEAAVEVAELASRLAARGHRLFPGKLDRSDLALTEKALVTLVRAPDGDFRPWPEVAHWAASIAASMLQPAARFA